jgi:CRP-like cAMP-binding protein
MNENIKIKDSSFWTNLFKSPTESEDLETLLRSMPPFEDVRKKSLGHLMELMHNRVYQQGEYLFYQGDPGVCLFIIREGEVKIEFKKDDTSFELVTLTRGDFFGEMALLEDDVRSASAIALTEVQANVIFRPDLNEFVERNPKEGIKILRGMAKILATRLRETNAAYLDLLIKSNGG